MIPKTRLLPATPRLFAVAVGIMGCLMAGAASAQSEPSGPSPVPPPPPPVIPPGPTPLNPTGGPPPTYAPQGPYPGGVPAPSQQPTPGNPWGTGQEYGPPQQQGYPPGYGPPQPARPLPTQMDFIEGAPLPPGYVVDTRPRVGLAVAGWVLFGSAYIPSIITAGFVIDGDREAGAGALFVPGIGPFITLGTTSPGSGMGVVLVLDGLAQSAGLVMGITAFAAQKKYVRPNHYFTMRFGPVDTGTEAPGFGVRGTF